MRISGSHQVAQQLDNTLANAFKVSAEARGALIPLAPLPFARSRKQPVQMSGPVKGVSGGEAIRDLAPTHIDPNDPKRKHQAIHKEKQQPASAVAAAEEETIDPKDALKELSVLIEQIRELWTEGRTWSADERVERRRSLVTTYV